MHLFRSPLAFFALVVSALSLALACSGSDQPSNQPIGAIAGEPSSNEEPEPSPAVTPPSTPAVTASTPPPAVPVNPMTTVQPAVPAPVTGCAAGEATCDGACVNIAQDALNCGECGTACPSGSGCVDGGCFCLLGLTACNGGCIDTSENASHCGACGNACAAGQACVDGACACGSDQESCNGVCVNTASDFANCGACGVPCGSDAVCASGVCSTAGCGDASLTACSGSCVNLLTDSAHCGACGSACAAGQACSGGTCGCNGGDSCNGVCVDTSADPANCGQCGMACPPGNACSGGSCQCPGGQEICSGQCTDTQMHTQHCGECGVVCGLGQLCVAGACSCPDSQEFCGTGCVTVASNALHCGACGNACPSGACNNGTCAPYEAGDTVIGWASVDGGTTGGASAESVDVDSASEFNSNTSGTTPRVVRVTANISGQLEITGSNKTIIGASADITINGGITIANADNIIVRNLHVNGSSSSEDGMLIDNSTHVWVDHCEFYDALDGNLDIKNAADLVTISWSKFYYSASPPSEDHRFSNLIGSSDGDTQDRGHLRITWHHNWWADRVHERMPRVRFGQVHVFNNYYSATGNNYCVRAGVEASILVENNYFDRVDSPHEIEAAGSSIVANGNFYNATTGAQDEAGSAFDPPYDYTMEAAESVANSVRAGAGPQ